MLDGVKQDLKVLRERGKALGAELMAVQRGIATLERVLEAAGTHAPGRPAARPKRKVVSPETRRKLSESLARHHAAERARAAAHQNEQDWQRAEAAHEELNETSPF